MIIKQVRLPEMAIRAVLRKHPAFDEPYRITCHLDEAEFMQVTFEAFNLSSADSGLALENGLLNWVVSSF